MLPPATTPASQPVSDDGRFALALAHLIGTGRVGGGTEGGFNDVRGDAGGATNFGISLRFAVSEARVDSAVRRLLDMDMDGDIDVRDIRLLTREAAAAVYRRCFWDRYQCGRLRAPMDIALFDQAVNGGGQAAVRMLQRAINAAYMTGRVVEPDGIMGPATIAYARKLQPETLAAYFRREAADRYRRIVAADPSQAKFLKGWLVRADSLGRT